MTDRTPSRGAGTTSGGGAPLTADDYRTVVLRTFRYLRIGMVVLVGLLGVAVILEVRSSGHLLDSLSAYYYSPAHSVFVASLCAIGMCLIVYRGRTDLEDLILNACGFLAFVVAFVPTTIDTSVSCSNSAAFCRVPPATVEANVSALLWVAAVSLALGFLISIRQSGAAAGSLVTPSTRIAFFSLLAGFVALAIFFLGWRQQFLKVGHYGAAGLFFVGIVIVVWQNGRRLGSDGWLGPRMTSQFVNRYAVGFYVMIASSVVLIIAARLKLYPHGLLWLETSLILQFAFFWVTQTIEQWND